MIVQPSSRTFKGENGRDEFQREKVASNVIRLLTSEINLSPMIIDGDWGTGKTEFCFKLINKFQAEHQNYRVLYVDAFQADHADNPLMTLLSSVMKLLPDGKEKSKLIRNAIPVFRYGLAVTGKAVVAHTLKQNANDLADGLDKVLQDAADKSIDFSLKNLLKDHEKAEENLKTLQATLEGIAKSSPIVIFVDELDRCRPDFAVQFLETIKHTFSVEGLKFVLVTNTRQLKAAINHRYGHQVNAQRYLDKFLKFSFSLPDHVPGRASRSDQPLLAAIEHFENTIRQSPVLKDSSLTVEAVYQFTRELIFSNSLSLREVETFARYLEIYHQLSTGLRTNMVWGYQLLNIVGVFVYCFFPDLVEPIRKKRVDAYKIAEVFGVHSLPDYKSDEYKYSYATPMAILLAQESYLNREKFSPKEDAEIEYWNQSKSQYFQRGYSRPADLFEPIRGAMNYLRLGES